MATWYRQNRYKKEARKQTLVSNEPQVKATVSARFQPSWAQLRARMEMSDELIIGWVECIGTYEFEEEEEFSSTNAAAPVQATVEFKRNFAPIGGQLIDAQFIAINRTVAVSTAPTPAAAPKNDPMRHLEQMSMGSLYRLASAMA